ncbi:MAG: response regulator transcription factor [Alphaproteobacteria bacterium]|nr:response regulator transcription factor [Alphaproteobacteria bacterium]
MKLEGMVDMTRCLLIDDDNRESRSLQKMLGALGVDTVQAAQAEEALQLCSDETPDMVVLAARGAGRRPKDFVRRLRRTAQGKAPVVFLFANTPDTDVIGQSILQGAADVLMQPIDRELLRFKLQQAGLIA